MINGIKKLIPVSAKNYLKKQYILARHKGNKYYCPLCNYHARDLAAFGQDYPVIKEKQIIGAGKRFGACYNCGSNERERHIFLYLKEKIKLFSNAKQFKVLHIAPETTLTKILHQVELKEYVCGDLILDEYREHYPSYIQQMDIRDIPYAENYFDLIICNHVLEHIPNDMDAMKELYRVLKPGGTAILQVPISKIMQDTYEDFSITSAEEKGKAFGQTDHVRIYGQDYTTRLSKSGFTVEIINLASAFPGCGLWSDEDIFVGRK